MLIRKQINVVRKRKIVKLQMLKLKVRPVGPQRLRKWRKLLEKADLTEDGHN